MPIKTSTAATSEMRTRLGSMHSLMCSKDFTQFWARAFALFVTDLSHKPPCMRIPRRAVYISYIPRAAEKWDVFLQPARLLTLKWVFYTHFDTSQEKDPSNRTPGQCLLSLLSLTSIWSGFCCTAASKSKTALGRSPSAKRFRPSSNASGWSLMGLSSSNW